MSEIKKVSVIGAGIMGAGIANSIFKRGFEVQLFDVDGKVAENAAALIRKQARKNMDPEKVRMAPTLKEAAQSADLVIEAVIEDLSLKKKLFAELDSHAPAHTIFASNTSSLPISEIARGASRPDRTIGAHFFNPAVIMRLVEVITPPATSKETCASLTEFITAIGKVAVQVKESPGFVVNRILTPLINEAFYLLEEHAKKTRMDVIDAANDIDSAMEKSGLLLMGPFNLVDLIGVDTSYKVANILYEGFAKNPCYLPAPLLKEHADKKRFGRKAGRGVYCYANQFIDPDQNPMLDSMNKPVVRLEQPSFSYLDLAAIMVNEGFRIVEEGIVASYKDVETCIELGARWPKGPFQLAKELGPEKIAALLDARPKSAAGVRRHEASRLLRQPTGELEQFLKS
ncbi:MAG: 3-hydroxyacyl-CoA dehydrogenase NAD-binding domain-containing protein [Elusimicrobiota bacterium]|jgi:3-hydroxybutyryl-CoA dehydrogenase